MGYSLALFTSPPPALAFCQKCKLVLEAPMWVCREDHAECKQCYNEQEPVCSTCAELGQEQPQEAAAFLAREASFVKRVVESLEIICTNKMSGCNWKGKLGEGQEHAAKCGYATVVCPNGCPLVMLAKDRSAHRRSTCPLQKLACRRGIVDGDPQCIYLRKDTLSHDESCQNWRCSVEGCSTRGPRAMVQQHEEECFALHDALSDAVEKLETMATEHEQERQQRDEALEELKEERDGLAAEAEDYEDSLETAGHEFFIVASRLRTLEEHLGLESIVDVDECCGYATLNERPKFPPVPAPPQLGVSLAQPAAAPHADWNQIDDFDLRPVANLSPAQAKLHKRLVCSFKAKKATEEAEEAAKEAAMDSDEELGDGVGVAGAQQVIDPIAQAVGPALPPTPPPQEDPFAAALGPARVDYCSTHSMGDWGSGPHIKEWIVEGQKRDSEGDGLELEGGSALKKQRM